MSSPISGFAESPYAWIEATGRGEVRLLGSPALVECVGPPGMNAPKLNATARYLAPPPRVCVLPGGLILGDQGAAASPDGLVFFSRLFRPTRTAFEHPAWRAGAGRVSRRLGGVVGLLAHHGGANIAHVLADGLARLWLLLEHQPSPDVFVLPAAAPPWRDELLALAGLPRERCVFVGPLEAIEAETLLLPEGSGFAWGMAPWAAQAARLLLSSSELGRRPERRLWISRKGCPTRRWIFEDAAAPELRRRGFEVVQLETLAVREQLTLAAEAEIVAGPHGAGLAWAVAAPPGCLLFELAAPRLVHNDFRALASVCGRYARTPAEAVSLSDEDEQHAPALTASPAAVLEALDEALAMETAG